MSIPPDSPWRGCAANFPQPLNQSAILAAQHLVETVYYMNCRIPDSPLPDIVYRSNRTYGNEGTDILRHVYRWDVAPYDDIFQNGFQVRRQQDTPDEVHFNLDQYVHHSGRPLDSRRSANFAFLSTTLNSAWYPSLTDRNTEFQLYRYEIYAPGGIWVAETLGDRYQFPSQDEVCFAAGIAPQYVRSAQIFRLIRDNDRHTRRVRVNNELIFNARFDPQSHPQRVLLNIQRPVDYYMDDDGNRQLLSIRYWPDDADPHRQRRQVSVHSGTSDWYAKDVAKNLSYIDAAFRSSRENEAYIFMKNEYVLLNYAPGTKDDRIVNGPLLICDGYPSLKGTAFGEYGIDCAFGSAWKDEAFIFSGNLCAVINYAPGTTDDWIKKGPMTILAMFPFLKGTVFESSVDAAFESTVEPEAYLFKGNKYALINYGPDCHLVAQRLITEGYPSLKDTIFKDGIDAAFASHRYNEAYIFKGDSYALINFAPASTDDYIIGGVKKILPNWPSLGSILPRENWGLDVHDHHTEAPDRDHDEL